MQQIITTQAAPEAIGAYSQAVKVGKTVYFSGQIPLDPHTMEIVEGDFKAQVKKVISNLQAVAVAAGGDLAHIVKLTIYLIDMGNFAMVNEVVTECWPTPFPARAVVGVSSLPKGAVVEAEAIMQLD